LAYAYDYVLLCDDMIIEWLCVFISLLIFHYYIFQNDNSLRMFSLLLFPYRLWRARGRSDSVINMSLS